MWSYLPNGLVFWSNFFFVGWWHIREALVEFLDFFWGIFYFFIICSLFFMKNYFRVKISTFFKKIFIFGKVSKFQIGFVFCVLILEIILRLNYSICKNWSALTKWLPRARMKDIFKIMTFLEISLIFYRGFFSVFRVLDLNSYHIGPILLTKSNINI